MQEGINKLDVAVHQIGQLSIMVEEHRKNVSAAAVKYDEILQRINEGEPLFVFHVHLPRPLCIYGLELTEDTRMRRDGGETMDVDVQNRMFMTMMMMIKWRCAGVTSQSYTGFIESV